jgi:hypothetical protein
MRRLVWIPAFLSCVCAYAGQEIINPAELVRRVRESENWIHEVESFQVRIESKWTRTPEGPAAKCSEAERDCDATKPASDAPGKFKTVSTGVIEYAFDKGRLRFLSDRPGERRTAGIWDGKQAVSHVQGVVNVQEHYYLAATPQAIGGELFSSFSWLRSQPHAFWWDSIDVEECLNYFGRPEDFELVGRADYRGVDCYVLQVSPNETLGLTSGQCPWEVGTEDRSEYGLIGQVRGLAGQSCLWYVGTEDGRLHGLVGMIDGKPHIKHWLLDYREVAPGRWLPMVQGYQVYERDQEGKPYPHCHSELKVVDVSIDARLPDELFKMDLKEGVKVFDERSGNLVTYVYEPEPPDLVGKTLPEFTGINIDFAREQAREKRILVCFCDINQRPSRHCLRQLAREAEDLKQKEIVIAAIQAAQLDPDALAEWVKKYNIPFTVGMVESDEDRTRFAWGVKSLPWLISVDKQGVVRTEGFSLDDLNQQIKQSQDDDS